jgi:hypothetical protein
MQTDYDLESSESRRQFLQSCLLVSGSLCIAAVLRVVTDNPNKSIETPPTTAQEARFYHRLS